MTNPAVLLTRRAKRAARLATAGQRALPDFVIIGAPKCGTTTVHHLLLPGDRNEVRAEVVEQLLRHFDARLASPEGLTPE